MKSGSLSKLRFFQNAEYAPWRALRKSEDAKYIGLVMPRFLSRLPYRLEGLTVSLRLVSKLSSVKGGWSFSALSQRRVVNETAIHTFWKIIMMFSLHYLKLLKIEEIKNG